MYCEQPPPKPPKPTCRCKNCVLRPEDIVPWTDLMGMSMTDREGTPSRRVSTRTRQSWDSVYTIADGDPHDRKSHVDQQGSNTPVQHTPVRNGGNTPIGNGTPREVSAHQHRPPAQPTILLIVVNKPEPPAYPGRGYPGSGPGYPGSGRGYPGPGRGYPGSAPGYPGSRQGYPGSRQGYPGSGPGYPGSGPGYPGPAPRGYPGPGPRRSPGPGTPNGYNYPPPGPGPTRGTYEDRFRNDGYGPYQNDSRYLEDWRRQSRGYPNNGYANPPRNRRPPDNQRSCRCPGKSNKSSTDLNEDRLQASGNRDVDNRLEGSGNPRSCDCKSEESYPKRNNRRRPRNCHCGDQGLENSDFSLNAESSQNIQEDFEELDKEEEMQEVVVTDGKNKTFKCIQVPICISVGRPDCCRCCKCAAAPAPDSESQSGKIDKDGDEECTCNPQGKCTCVDDTTMPDEFACECNLTNLERTLRNLIPNADCMCYLKKKRRRRRKKWAPKVFYDRFANPPFVLNPKPRCLEYGCSPCCNPCYNRCCCAPVAKSCYSCDYRCGGGC